MKKSLSFLLALIAVASLSLNAFALENENAQQNDLTHEEIVAENENEKNIKFCHNFIDFRLFGYQSICIK